MKRYQKIASISLATLMYLFSACGTKKEEAKVSPVNVKICEIASTSDFMLQGYVGVIEENSSTNVSYSQVGTIENIMVHEGERVKKGQLVVQIDPTQAQNALSIATAQLKQAEDALSRMKQLHESNSIPEIKWVETQSKVDQARAQVEICKKQLKDCSIYAPVSGVVGKKVMARGETALPGLPIFSILDIQQVKVKVPIPEKEINSVKTYTASSISVEAIKKSFNGGSIEKSVESDALTHTYNIYIYVNNPNGELLPGMVCNVKMRTGLMEYDEVIALPIISVQQGADGTNFVWVVEGNVAKRKQIELGQAVGNNVIITNGLTQGEKVILEGYHKLSEGSEVKIL